MITTVDRAAGDLVGKMLGEFVLIERIGEGGFGVVYRAEQPTLRREAVVKVLADRHAARPAVAERFLHEAHLASKLDHPYAAHVYAFGAEPDGRLWIAMELVRGTSLDKLLAVQGAMAVERFVPLFERICEVVHTAHEQGIVHRDIKPDNVMVLSRAGRLLPKLLDFGIARAVDDANHTADTSSVVGSPGYMAPEQWIDPDSAGPASDVYALGVLCAEALTGRAPFGGATVAEVMKAHAQGVSPGLLSGVPDVIEDAIRRALSRDPEQRQATAIDLAAAVRRALPDEAVPLPQLDEPLRVALITSAPQPLAEVVSALEGARNVDHAGALLGDVVAVAARWLAILALACRARVGPGDDGADNADAALRRLARDRPGHADWLDLARALTRPFEHQAGAYPLPELIGLLHGADGAQLETHLGQLASEQSAIDRAAGRSEPQRRDLYAQALHSLGQVLRCLLPLLGYTLVVTRNRRAEQWRGLRRSPRAVLIRRASPLPEGEPTLVDAEGVAVLRLAPLVQTAPPMSGAPDELFVFDGKAELGARLLAMPHAFERTDPELWEWFRIHLFDPGDDAPSGAPAAPRAPYRGLAPFTGDDAADYFGREREVERFVNRLRVDPMVTVVGASGAGKSSFVHAGVVPALPSTWRAISVRPGPSPMAVLVSRLERDGIDARDAVADPAALAARVRDAVPRGGRLVIVIDQLEELFTLCRDHGEQERYAETIGLLAVSADDPVRVVLTLRDDFLVRAEQLAPLRDRMSRALVVLTTPSAPDLERIVTEPARRAGHGFDPPGLVAEMVAEVAHEPGALALLSFTAAELWKLRDRQFRQLTRRAYAAIGGVGGALARHADDVLAALGPDEQRLVRDAFRSLVTAEGTRQVLSVAELEELLGRGARARAVIDRLVSARLLVTSEEAGGQRRIEVIHESLLERWPTLVKWRQEDAEGARLRDQLLTAARQWDARGRPHGLLWRDDALAEYRLWRARHPGPLTVLEQAFGDAGIADARRRIRSRRLLVAAAFATLAAGSAVLYELRGRAEQASDVAHQQTEIARGKQTELAAQLVRNYAEQARRALVAGDASTALVYFDAAIGKGADSPVLRFMIARALEPFDGELTTLRGHRQPLWSVSFSTTGARVLTSGSDGTARVWETSSGRQLAVLDTGATGPMPAAFSADGQTIATGGSDGRLRLWETETGRQRAVLAAQGGPILATTFSPDGRIVATTGEDGTTRLWATDTGAALLELATGPGDDIRFDPRGTLFVVSSRDRVPTIWTTAGRKIAELRGHTDAVWYAAWSPSGDRIATASLDGTARVWDARSGRTIAELRGHERRVTDVAFSPDGSRVATASADRTARLWDPVTGKLEHSLHGHTAQVNRVVFSHDGAAIVTAGAEGTARIWDTAHGVAVGAMVHGGFVFDVDVNPSGVVATASWNGTAKLWTLARPSRMSSIMAPGTPRALAVSTDGRWAVAASETRAVVQQIAGTARHELSPGGELTAAALSADGARVALACRDGTVLVATTGRPDQPQRWQAHPGGATAVAFEPAGTMLASAGADGTVALWMLDGARLQARRAIGPAAASLQFSPDGTQLLAVGEGENAIATLLGPGAETIAEARGPELVAAAFAPDSQHWAVAAAGSVQIRTRTGAVIATLDHGAVVGAIAWSPASDRLLTGGVDGTVISWQRRGDTWLRHAVLKGHDNWIAALAFSPDQALIASSSGDETLRFWDAATMQTVSSIPSAGVAELGLAFDSDGERLIGLSVRGTIEVRRVDRYPDTAEALGRFVRCRVPLVLENESLRDGVEGERCPPPRTGR